MRFCFWVAALLIFVPCADAQTKRGKSLNSLRGKLRHIERRKQEVRTQLRITKREAKNVVQDIKQVDSTLGDLEDSLGSTQERLAKSRARSAEVAQELDHATKTLATERKQIGNRLRAIYMQVNPTLVSALIGSKDVGDIASRQMLYERVSTKERALFDSYRSTLASVTSKKRESDQLVVQIQGLLGEEKAKQAQLKQAREKKSHYLGELNDRMGELKEMASQYEQDEQEITSQIQSYLRELASRPSAPHRSLGSFSGRFSRPVSASMTSGFGYRYHPILHTRRLHAGVDFGAPSGTPIHAAAEGIVVSAQRMGGYGNVIILDHGGGYATVYGHCSRILVSSGAHVSRGQVIGRVGSTGLSTGPHLHFEVRINGRPVNPLGKL